MSDETASEERSEWRAFELLVSRIEGVLRSTNTVVRSPDRLRDLETGDLREVDCSLTTETPTGTETISIECRRRRGKEDVTWIEQLASKRVALGLKETIAVSSRGFSRSAYTKAALHGITLKTYEEAVLDIASRPVGIARTRTTTVLKSFEYEVFFDSVQPTSDLQRVVEELIENAKPETPILRRIGGEEVATYQGIVDLATAPLSATPADASLRKFRLTFQEPTTFVGFPDETVLEALILQLSVGVTQSSVPEAVFGRYGTRGVSELEVVKTPLLIGGLPANVEILYQLVDVDQPAS